MYTFNEEKTITMGRTLTVMGMTPLLEDHFGLTNTKFLEYDEKDTLEGKYTTYEEVLTKIQEILSKDIDNESKIVCVNVLSTIAYKSSVPFEIQFN